MLMPALHPPTASTPALATTPVSEHSTTDAAGGADVLSTKNDPAFAADIFAPDLHAAQHLWLKGCLLLVWAVVSFGACFFARDLQRLAPKWSLAYWVAAQGAVLVFMLIVVVYAYAMDHLEGRKRPDHEALACERVAADGVSSHG
jgi:putative solute:sodium symporter small subunit